MLDGGNKKEIIDREHEALKFEKIICSDYKRTRQTAEPIVDSTNVPIKYSELFREERPPSSWRDRPEKSPEGTKFFNDMVEKAGDPSWQVEDAENASDVFERIKKALKLLEEDSVENILVVSHGSFLKQ